MGIGLDPIRAVLVMHLTAVVLGLVAFMALDATVLAANLVFAGVALVGSAVLVVLSRIRSNEAA
jgi:hypothetical protein